MKLGYMPGEGKEYIHTFEKILEFIQKSNPTKEEFKDWFLKTFDVSDKTYLRIIKNLDLIVEVDNRLLLSDFYKEFLKTHDMSLLLRKFLENDSRIVMVLKLLYDEPQTLAWRTERPYGIILNWLQSMNFVTRKSRKYFLTSEGDKFVENVINSKERSLHDKIKETIFKLGSYYNLYCEREYMMEHSDVTQKKEYFDVAWKRDIKGDPTMVFEVHLEGDPFEALSKLSLAYGTWKSEPYLIISSEDKKTRKIALTHFAPLNNVIKILTLEELDQWYNRMKLADNETRRHVGIGVRLTLKAKKIKKNLNDDLPDT